MGVLLVCLCGVSMSHYALSYGLCLCGCVFVRVGLNVLVRFDCDSLCDVVCCVWEGVCVCVCAFFFDCAWMPCL